MYVCLISNIIIIIIIIAPGGGVVGRNLQVQAGRSS